ncbi:MAG: threonine-phosphate decarboxylase CobD [Candidatus Bathyarchaeota archaeon]|nr:threonine-phosphate decarboxylase CobD [Candidatus Bathyarchaeota archaeon]
MKPVECLVRDGVRGFRPCVHGAEVLGAALESGLLPGEILDFSSSVNPLGSSRRVLDAVVGAFGQVAAYPDSNSTGLRQVIAEHYGVGCGNVVVGNGSTELMYLFADAFLKRGEWAVMPAPTFGEYESAVCKTGERVEFVRLGEGFKVDVGAFKRQMRGAKLVFLCNPNNPTSMLIPQNVLRDIVEEALVQDALVFLDEDFLEFVDDEQSLSLIGSIDKYPNLFVLRSFTKIFGLTGLRVGYGIANRDIVDVLLKVKIPWNVNCLAQVAAVAALRDEEHLRITRELIKEEKAWLGGELARFGSFSFCEPDANFFFIDIRKSGLTAAGLKAKLLSEGILIRDCSSFRGLDEFYVRVAVKTHEENVRLIGALKRVLGAV